MLSRKSAFFCGKFYNYWRSDLSSCIQALRLTNSSATQQNLSLRKRRSVRRPTTAGAADRNVETTVQSLSDAIRQSLDQHTARDESDHESAFGSNSRSNTSVDSLKNQLNAAVRMQEKLDVEFPSDVPSHRSSSNQREQSRHAFRPDIDPTDTSVVLFPGQGSQFVGMGAKLLQYPKVEDLYKTATRILGYNLLDMCLTGPKDVLDRTLHSQPAVLVTSLAAVEKLKHDCPAAIENCVTAAGYDVGEYAALVFTGAMSFEDAVRLVKIRASTMQSASTLVSSGMMVIHFDASARVKSACHTARQYCKQELQMTDCVCDISTFLYPGCKVLSGNREALEFIEQHRADFGIQSVEHLPLSGAFHTRLMNSTVSAMNRAVATVELKEPIVPVLSNVTAKRHRAPADTRRLLVDQLRRPLCWEQTMHVMYGRPLGTTFPRTFEVGPGRRLGYLLKQVNAKAYEQYDRVDV